MCTLLEKTSITAKNDSAFRRTIKLGQPKPARAPNRMVCTAARSAWAGRRAQSGAPSCATRTAVNDNQYMTLYCRLKPVRILRLCASSNTVCTAARTKRPGIRTRGPRVYRPLARKLRLLLNVRLIRTMSTAAHRLAPAPPARLSEYGINRSQ